MLEIWSLPLSRVLTSFVSVVLKSPQVKTVASLGEFEQKAFSNVLHKSLKDHKNTPTRNCVWPVPRGGSLALNNHMVRVKIQVAYLFWMSVCRSIWFEAHLCLEIPCRGHLLLTYARTVSVKTVLTWILWPGEAQQHFIRREGENAAVSKFFLLVWLLTSFT